MINFAFGRKMVKLNMYDLCGNIYNYKNREFATDKLQAVIEKLIEVGYRELT